MSKTVTIKDIAGRLGVSTSTVSRALTDKWDVSPETRQLVTDAARQMGYKPNIISLGLRKSQSLSVGVILPELMNDFFAEVLMGINSVLQAHNYQAVICQSDESPVIERRNVEFLTSRCVDGFIVSCTHETENSDYYQALLDEGVPIVFMNRICRNVNAPKIVIDDRKWAFAATEHLIKQGCRHIAHLAGPGNLSVSEQRKQGYIDALTEYGLPVNKSLIIPSGIFLQDGKTSAESILRMKNKPDGLFAVNDPSAIGAMKVLMKAGMRVPEDIAIAGFSHSRYSDIIDPPLTSVAQPTFEIGASAARLLLEWLSSKSMPHNRELVLDARLVIGQSSLRGGQGQPR